MREEIFIATLRPYRAVNVSISDAIRRLSEYLYGQFMTRVYEDIQGLSVDNPEITSVMTLQNFEFTFTYNIRDMYPHNNNRWFEMVIMGYDKTSANIIQSQVHQYGCVYVQDQLPNMLQDNDPGDMTSDISRFLRFLGNRSRQSIIMEPSQLTVYNSEPTEGLENIQD